MNTLFHLEPARCSRPYRFPSREKGVVLFIALIVLVAMSMAGISMMRAVDAGTKIAGNLAFRQSATQAAEPAFETAMSKVLELTSSGAANTSDQSFGFSNSFQGVPASDRDWNSAWNLGVEPKTGNTVAMFVDMMCLGGQCQQTMGQSSSVEGQSRTTTGGSQIPRRHFRILTRITNPQGLVTYIEGKIY